MSASGRALPRPRGALPGGLPPWASLDGSRDIDLARVDVARVRDAFARRRPASPATVPDAVLDVQLGTRRAAVLVPLFDESGEARVLLTRRSSSLRSHTGQVAFPGGRLDPGESAVHAALREASEEVGIQPGAVEILGELTMLTTVSSGSLVTPFVGATPGRPSVRPNPEEVERVFDVRLADLLVDGVYRQERWPIGSGEPKAVHFFEVGGEVVWGATAQMLYELLGLVTGSH